MKKNRKYALGFVVAVVSATMNLLAEDFKETEARAKSGNVEAMYELGLRYDGGDGVERNVPEAVKWYRKAAENGNIKAMRSLGYSYVMGIGVAKDVAEGTKWFNLANEKEKSRDAANDVRSQSVGDYSTRQDDVASLIAKAKAKKSSTFVFKGFYLGMPAQNALVLLRHYDRETKYEIVVDGITANEPKVPTRKVVTCESGMVTEFRFSRRLIDMMFRTKGMSGENFCQSVVNAYDVITSLKGKLVLVADWEARRVTKEDVQRAFVEAVKAGLAKAYRGERAGDDAFKAIMNKAASQKFTCGYSCDSLLGFELTIAPTDDDPEWQTDFFVVRKTHRVGEASFD